MKPRQPGVALQNVDVEYQFDTNPAFTDLVTWVEAGVEPAGDNVLDPSVVEAPDFGCAFTDKISPRQWDLVPALAFLKPPSCPAP